MNIIINKLNYRILKRVEEKSFDGSILRHGSESVDFTIDNNSLLNLLVKEYGGHNDFMGCFIKRWDKSNEYSTNKLLNKLLNKLKPETKGGRIAIYVCPECVDISCGAYCCKIENTNETYIWNDFAYENNYEDARTIENIGPFYFNKIMYEEIIFELSLI